MRSGTVGHHFAGNGNPFWRLLHAAKLTPVPDPNTPTTSGWRRSASGLTNLCPRTTRTAAELTRDEIARGRGDASAQDRALEARVVVAFVGVSLYPLYFARPRARRRSRREARAHLGARGVRRFRTRAVSTRATRVRSQARVVREVRKFVDRVTAARDAPIVL
jgi:G:T/U-mismatch repair DNA glycosylase